MRCGLWFFLLELERGCGHHAHRGEGDCYFSFRASMGAEDVTVPRPLAFQSHAFSCLAAVPCTFTACGVDQRLAA